MPTHYQVTTDRLPTIAGRYQLTDTLYYQHATWQQIDGPDLFFSLDSNYYWNIIDCPIGTTPSEDRPKIVRSSFPPPLNCPCNHTPTTNGRSTILTLTISMLCSHHL